MGAGRAGWSGREVRSDACGAAFLPPHLSHPDPHPNPHQPSWSCAAVLRYRDWVLDVAARGGLLLVAAAREVAVHDLETHALLHRVRGRRGRGAGGWGWGGSSSEEVPLYWCMLNVDCTN